MVSADTIAVFIPILFLLVVELANITRQTVDLSTLADNDPSPIEIAGRSEILGWPVFPNLGRFLFIHWGSMMLLSITIFVAWTFTDGLLQGGLLFATAILLYLYPVFEIAEYDILLTDETPLRSYRSHLLYITILIPAVASTPFVVAVLRELGGGSLSLLYFAFTFIFLPFLAARAFTIRLQNELMEIPQGE